MSNLAYEYQEDSYPKDSCSEDSFVDEFKEEMLDGKIYFMAPPLINHSLIASRLFASFFNYLKGKKCQAFFEAGYVKFSKKDKVQPDIMVVCNPDIIKKDGIYGSPDLIIEVLSPSTAKRDRITKKNLYEKHGVGEYWLVDPRSFSIEVYLLKKRKYVLIEVYTWASDELMTNGSDDDKAAIQHEVSPALFPDLVIKMEDIFGGWLVDTN